MRSDLDQGRSVLSLDGWMEFNRRKWGFVPLRVTYTDGRSEIPAVEAVLYLDRSGRVTQPRMNPYLPVTFTPSPTESMPKVYRQWDRLSRAFAHDLASRGVRGSVALSPDVTDIRQWRWHGFVVDVRYTFWLSIPYSLESADYSVVKQVKKAQRSGFTSGLASREQFDDVIACLRASEIRQGFSYRIEASDLALASECLGEQNLRAYVCRSPSGEAVASRVVIAAPGHRCVDWAAGTKAEYLSSGATQFLIWEVLNDLEGLGARGFDFAGANIPSVSAAKADWGGVLMPYYGISALNTRTLARLGLAMVRKLGARR